MIRLAHISDIHVSTHLQEWRFRDYLNKRMAGWINHRVLGRRHRFRHAEKVLAALIEDFQIQKTSHVVFSGDATALGFESEFKKAAHLLQLHEDEVIPGIAVPGNHDYSTRHSATSGHFERYFSKWQVGQRIDDNLYPFAQKVGDFWLIGLNSSAATRFPWDATGRVGTPQVRRLEKLLERLDDDPKILVTHYPVCLHNGRKENPWRHLRDLRQLIQVATDGGVSLWLHGHRHKGYHLPEHDHAPFPVICAGSSTQTGIWSYCEYAILNGECTTTRRTFNPRTNLFEITETFQLTIKRKTTSASSFSD